jgi:hypothetical protein
MPEVRKRQAHDPAFCVRCAIKRQQILGGFFLNIQFRRRLLRRRLRLPLASGMRLPARQFSRKSFSNSIYAAAALLACFLLAPTAARAQAGPPLITNDPGTPGPEEWEINLGIMPVLRQHEHDFQLPQLDFNYGVGNTIQLTFELPYVLQTAPQPQHTGWSNSFPGVKWRFIDNFHGWNVSMFPQMELTGTSSAIRQGIAERSTRFLLPFEIQKRAGPMELDFEAGYYFPVHGHEERILGFAAGHQLTKKLELIGEVYNDSAMGALPHDTTWDMGGRYGFHKGLILLFMAGRSFSSVSSGQPTFFGYIGVQILLEKNGRRLHSEE